MVELWAAPEWLSKLESRREKLEKSGKLGHEIGAGAKCNDCGDKCPGLDLHFWRKVCRNCKCRKDQHMCTDEDLSGWAQFEILGQIRSKPAYMKIKALANQSVQLDWIPPNADPEVVSDYMSKLGSEKIPVAGSDAAAKRKQQLEFQVPPHDLDAGLCDNLTESEATQLQQYVQKIRENCVGQGSVVRVGNVIHGRIGNIPQISTIEENCIFTPEYAKIMAKLNEPPIADSVLGKMLTSEKLVTALFSEVVSSFPKIFVAFSEPLAIESPTELNSLPEQIKQKLCGLNKESIQSLIANGQIYDKILDNLRSKNLDIRRDPQLGPIADFRKEYLNNPKFKQQINSIVGIQYPITPNKIKSIDTTPFNSPIPLKNPTQGRFPLLIRQDTPIRKVKFNSEISIIHDLGLPLNIDYEKDQVFSLVVNSVPLRKIIQPTPTSTPPWIDQQLIISSVPLSPDFDDDPVLSENAKNQLNSLPLNTALVQSVIINGQFYDKLFDFLNNKNINYSDCKILGPIKELREQMFINQPFAQEILQFVDQLPNNEQIIYAKDKEIPLNGSSFITTNPFITALSVSRSTDSGFDSKPSTPNYSTHPALVTSEESIIANSGHFSTIPGIEDMNMYPECVKSMNNMKITNDSDTIPINTATATAPISLINCYDCKNSILSGEVAVKAERAGKEIAWHPDCFKCYKCRELLADLVYFFHGGHVYCGRDLAIILKIPRCKACDELIFTKEYTAAEDSTFHIKHFCCLQCDEPLAGQQYIPDEKTNMPLCLKCYHNYFAKICQLCKKAIGPTGQGVAWGEIHWHSYCFICAGVNCSKSLIGGRFCVKKEMPFCSPACVRSVVK